MNPQTAIEYLIKDHGMTEMKIAKAVNTSQANIHRIKTGTQPNYPLGRSIVDLAESMLIAPESKAA